MSQFAFLQAEFPAVFDLAQRSELLARADARGACFYARLALESAVKWMYAHDASLKAPYDTALSALIHEPTFRALVGNALVTKARIIKDYGNFAAHEARDIPAAQAETALRELFHFCFWLVRTYARGAKPEAQLTFRADALPRTAAVELSTLAKLQALAKEREDAARALEEAQTAQLKTEAERAALEAANKQLLAEIAAVKAANTKTDDTHDYNEAQTRDAFIDLLLREAGWPLSEARDREFPVRGMPSTSGDGFVDYVLWGDDGKPLALVEAKRARRDPRVGQQQAKLYADCLQTQFGVRPLIFYSNGYEHWLWDDAQYPPRAVSGFLKKDELVLWQQRKATRTSLLTTSVDAAIADRFYQTRAVKRVGDVFENEHHRKALLVMATGSGKTRVVIALIDQLMRANWVKRVLFLADRVALVKQAHNNFKKHLPSAPSANLIERHDAKQNDHHTARVCVATYPTMMGLIDTMQDGQRAFGAGHFDLIVIDEAHRSVYRKYKAIFEYFDSLLVGLTATPREEIDRDTYSLFEIEKGVPTDSYELTQAVADGFLVPPIAASVPLKFVREGIRYDALSDDDKAKWDDLEWEGKLPHGDVDPGGVNKWLFNTDTVDKVLEHLMTHGIKVAEGDRLGKTIIFAKNHDHAAFIAERFNANYPHFAGQFARLIDFQTEYAQSLIDNFSITESAPHIAISVDMLDTGIDVPDVVNLVFFKVVRSKTKFWQMIGRGTRLRPDLFGPGRDKKHFLIFDYCQNFEYFDQNPNRAEPKLSMPLSERLFIRRVEIVGAIEDDRTTIDGHEGLALLDRDTRERLFEEVSGMSMDNFLVRAKRRAVEHFQKRDAWRPLSRESRERLISEVAGLPTALTDYDIAAKQFDYVVLSGELALLKHEPSFVQCKEKVMALAGKLEGLSNIPLVAAEMALILELQTDEYWEGIDAWALEQMRRRLRALMKLIQSDERLMIFTDFEDEIGEAVAVALPNMRVGLDRERFEMKVQHFLRAHSDHLTILKLRRNEQLTPLDLTELERMMVEEGAASSHELGEVQREVGLGLFIRSIVGMERESAKAAFADFLANKPLNANQIEFVNLIVNHLTERGAMEPRRLYESPFTDFDDQGVQGLFADVEVQRIVQVLRDVKSRAAA